MQRLHHYASFWGLDVGDLVLIAALAIVVILPVSHDVERASKAGPFARVAMSREIVNHRALDERTLPLWNPYQFGGRPHLAHPEMLSLYPPHMLLRFLPLPLFVALVRPARVACGSGSTSRHACSACRDWLRSRRAEPSSAVACSSRSKTSRIPPTSIDSHGSRWWRRVLCNPPSGRRGCHALTRRRLDARVESHQR